MNGSPLLYPPTRSLVRRQEGDQAVAWRRTVAGRREMEVFGSYVFRQPDIVLVVLELTVAWFCQGA